MTPPGCELQGRVWKAGKLQQEFEFDRISDYLTDAGFRVLTAGTAESSLGITRGDVEVIFRHLQHDLANFAGP